MKKFVQWILLLCLIPGLLCPIGLQVAADAPVHQGSCGEALLWSYDTTTASLSIEGLGAMEDYVYSFFGLSGSSHPWADLSGEIRKVVISEGVTTIGDYAFYNCPALEEVQLPDSLERIGKQAFAYCNKLPAISMPHSLTELGADAFSQCINLSSVSFSEALTQIPDRCFYSCVSLRTLELPQSITALGTAAFYLCGIKSLSLPEGLTQIGDTAFSHCGALESVILPSSLRSIGANAFSYCGSLKELALPDGLVRIGDEAFCSCDALDSIVIPHSVTELGLGVFLNCSALTHVSLGSGITAIPGNSFMGCSTLINISICGELTEIHINAFRKCSALKHFIYSGSDAQWDTVEKTQARMPEEYILHSSAAGDEVSQIETPNGAYLYCRLCCQALTPVPECSHSDTSKINEIAPTCTGHGYSGDLCCTRCGEILSYGESLPPLGHQFENNACIRCGLIDPQSNPFSDVSSSDYFFDPVLWAVNKGITTGTDETHFSPEGACTRGQIVTFLYRANS